MRITLLCTMLLMCGCASADVMRLDQVQRAPVPVDQVRVLLEEPNEPYVAIALIETSDEGWGLGLESLKNKLVSETAKLGGQAVIVGHASDSGGTAFIPIGQMWYAAEVTEKKLIGKVIIFAPK